MRTALPNWPASILESTAKRFQLTKYIYNKVSFNSICSSGNVFFNILRCLWESLHTWNTADTPMHVALTSLVKPRWEIQIFWHFPGGSLDLTQVVRSRLSPGTYHLGEGQLGAKDILIFSRWEPGPHPGGKVQALAHVVRPMWELQIFWSCENRKYFEIFSLNPIVQMLIVTGGYHVGHKLKSTEVIDCSSFSHHDAVWRHCWLSCYTIVRPVF